MTIILTVGAWDKEHDWWGEDWDQWESAEGGEADGRGEWYQIWWGK